MRLILNLLVIVLINLVSGNPLISERRLIKTSAEAPAVWMTENQIWKNLIGKHRNFIDITDHLDAEDITDPPNTSAVTFPYNKDSINIVAIPRSLNYHNETREVIGNINSDRFENFIKVFTNFYNRYYTAKTGTESQKWLLSQVQESLVGYKGNASVEEFHHDWSQCSIIARIQGSNPTLKSEVIILGAHQDSINMFGKRLRAPGADDNAAGSAVVLESLRTIVDSNFIPQRTLEFHWYAAEEVGLRGSAAIAQAYKAKNVNVVGMVNFDVPGYQSKENVIGIYTDNADATLTDFLRILVDEYLDYGRVDDKCGYGCSDHASFTRYGYPAAMPAESTLHPMMHTHLDDHSRVGFTQIKEFVKLGVSTLVEFGLPTEVEA